MDVTEKKNRQIKVPHVMVMLLVILILAGISTYVVTPGEYARMEVNGRTVIDPASYQVVERNVLGIFEMLKAIPQGLSDVSYIVFFCFIIGGAFKVVQETGAILAGISIITRKLKGREKMIIPVIMILFALAGSLFGMAEETLAFIPLIVPLALTLGFDSITGVAMVLVGAGAGFAGAWMNPFTVGIAQGIVELPIFSGVAYRAIVWSVLTGIAIIYVYRYASKIKKDPQLSPVYEEDLVRDKDVDFSKIDEITISHKLVLVTFFSTFVLLVYGVTKLGWYINELAALFIGMALLCGIFGKLGADNTAKTFIDGAKDLTMAALVIGLARGVLIVLTEGHIIDTVLHSMANVVQSMPGYFSALAMYVFQCLLNIIVPSGSGQAALTMPIMGPLSDLAGVTRQTAVLAYQLGDGFTNIMSPTCGYFMGILGLVGIKWEKWAKWFLPLLIMWFIAGGVFVVIAHITQFGPF